MGVTRSISQDAIAVWMPDDSGSPLGSASNPLVVSGGGIGGATTTKPASSATATKTSVAGSATAVSLLAANTARLPGSTITNDSSSILYILLGAGTASATNYTIALDAKTTVPGTYFIPDGWTGAVSGIWAVASGNALITEIAA